LVDLALGWVRMCLWALPSGQSELRVRSSCSGDTHLPRSTARGAKGARQAGVAKRAQEVTLIGRSFPQPGQRDLANVSVVSLIRLCAALDVFVGSLFRTAKGEVVQRTARPPINFGGPGVREYLLTPSGEKRVQAILSDIEPAAAAAANPYSLPADVEFVFVLAGKLEIAVADQHLTLDQGDSFIFPPSAQHSFQVSPAAGRTQVLWVFSPRCQTPTGERRGRDELHQYEASALRRGYVCPVTCAVGS
jgi:quercetin dioxygenase-like cupin family protein